MPPRRGHPVKHRLIADLLRIVNLLRRSIAIGPPPHTGSPTPEESKREPGKSTLGQGPKSPEKKCAPESQKSPKRVYPGPPTLAFLEKARVFSPQKSKGVSLRGTPKILGAARKKAQKKQGKSENKKSKEIEKSKEKRRVRVKVRFWTLLGLF